MKKIHGHALIFDCHSMNSIGLKNTPDEGMERPDFAIGTLDDTSADKKIISAYYKTLKEEAGKFSLTVEKNNPYKGGYITQKYGKPSDNVHVIQLEMKRSLFMNESLNGSSIEDFKLNLTELKKINSGVKVIVVTIVTRQESVDEATKLGAKAYIMKPVTEKKLIPEVKRVVGGGSVATAPVKPVVKKPVAKPVVKKPVAKPVAKV